LTEKEKAIKALEQPYVPNEQDITELIEIFNVEVDENTV
jgi:hypothetical protein